MYGEECLSRTSVSEWYEKIRRDAEWKVRPSATRTEE
jgi:hypothetical protein